MSDEEPSLEHCFQNGLSIRTEIEENDHDEREEQNDHDEREGNSDSLRSQSTPFLKDRSIQRNIGKRKKPVSASDPGLKSSFQKRKNGGLIERDPKKADCKRVESTAANSNIVVMLDADDEDREKPGKSLPAAVQNIRAIQSKKTDID